MIDFKSQIYQFKTLLNYQKSENQIYRDDVINWIYENYLLSAHLKTADPISEGYSTPNQSDLLSFQNSCLRPLLEALEVFKASGEDQSAAILKLEHTKLNPKNSNWKLVALIIGIVVFIIIILKII